MSAEPIVMHYIFCVGSITVHAGLSENQVRVAVSLSPPPRISVGMGGGSNAPHFADPHIKHGNALSKIEHMSWLESSEQAEKARVQSVLWLSSI